MTAQDRTCPFDVDDEFVLRTPLLPLGTVLQLGEACEANDGVESPSAGSWVRSVTAYARDPLIREAIGCASPSLVAALDARDGIDEQVGRAVMRYVVRMASRPTLFGLFAGTSVGRFDVTTHLELGTLAEQRRISRPPAPHLLELAAPPLADGAALHDVPCTVNGTLVRQPAGLSCFRNTPHGAEAVHIEGEDAAAVVDALEGDATPRALASALATSSGRPASHWLEVIDLLLEHGALVSHVTPAVTGPPLTEALIESLGATSATKGRAEAVAAVRDAVAGLDAEGLVPSPAAMDAVERAYASALGRVPAPPAEVQLLRPAPLTLPRTFVDDVADAVAVLGRFGARPCPPELARLRDALTRTFGERRVPLVQCFDLVEGLVLDPAAAPATEHAPLLDGIPFPEPAQASPDVWTARDALLLERLRETWTSNSDTLELRQSDIDAIAPRLDVSTMMLRGELLGTPEDPRLYARALLGPTGAELLAQVRHACPRIDAMAKRQLAHERAAHGDAIVADVCHAAQPAADAVIRRPRDDGYELVCLGRSSSPLELRILAADLEIVVEDDEVRLYSRRLARRIVPRLSCNHDYLATDLPLYRMLALLQRQDADRHHLWSWGPLSASRRLPRVRWGRVIVAPQTWRVPVSQLVTLRGAPASSIRDWVERLGLPRLCWIEGIEPRMLVDLHRPDAIDELVHAVARRDDAILSECLVAREGSPVRGPGGPYASEILVPLRRPTASEPSRAVTPSPPATPRSPSSGSPWLYARISGNPVAVDELLQGSLGEAVEQLARTEGMVGLHFLFYDEPRFHLRLRFQGDPSWLGAVALRRLWACAEPLLHGGTIWGFELDTYVPEVARFGGLEGLRAAEAMFDVDSRTVLSMRRHGPAGTDPDLRWLACLASTDALARDLGVAQDDRAALFERLATARQRDLGDTVALRHAVGRKYRALRPRLEAVRSGQLSAVALESIAAPLADRSRRLAPIVESLDHLVRTRRLGVERTAFIDAILHLHVNRMLPLAAHAHELVVYGLLHRIHASQCARRRHATARATAQPHPPVPPR